MSKFNADQAALVAKATAFSSLFSAFSAATDPISAFVLSLIATLVLSAVI